MNFAGKTAVVTGGGRDIGRSCVMALAAAGANVVINYHSSSEGADSAVAEITAAGGKAIALQGDMTNPADIEALVAKTVETYGAIDTLMHVTGGLVARKTTDEMDLDHWNTVMTLNTTSLFLAVKACLPHMADGSSIVTFASQAGRDGGGGGSSVYAASKGAVMTYTRALAKELGPRNIRVNSLCPGMIDTDFHNIFTKDAIREFVANATPLKREGNPDEVAKLAVFLASDDASFMTGNNVDINGGLLFS
jgi:3-oxoacyl-[acyl-carrier protein] reductase